MFTKHNEIEAIVEDLIETVIVELLGDSLSSKKECEFALNMLIDKLEELDTTVFREFFDN
jgi:hypothetical protein